MDGHQAHGNETDRHDDLILDPSLVEVVADVSYREQRQHSDAGDPSMMLKHYLSGEGPQHRADEMEGGFRGHAENGVISFV